MSTDWNVHCVDCNSTLRFNDANHLDRVMLALCKHAEAIAALDDLMREPAVAGYIDFRLGSYGAIDTGWFRAHLGHQLLPISEYGEIFGHCREYFVCEGCGSQHHCTLAHSHDGAHRRSR